MKNALGALCIPLASVLWIIAAYFVPVIHHEQMESFLAGYDTKSGIIAGHKLLFVNRLYALIRFVHPAWAPPYPTGMYMIQSLSIAAALVTAAILFALLTRTSEKHAVPFLPALCMAGLVFSIAQWENWTSNSFLFFGSVLSWFGVVASLVFMKKYANIVVAVVCAVAGTFMSGNGIAIWLAALPLVLLQKKTPPKEAVVLWCVGAVVATAYFFSGNTEAAQAASMSPDALPGMLRYASTLLGGVLVPFIPNAMYAGMVLSLIALLLIVFSIRSKNHETLPWVCTVAFAVLTALIIAAGRSHHGIGHALSSRYTTLMACFVIGCIGIMYSLFPKKRWPFVCIVLLLVGANVFWFQKGYETFAHRANKFRQGQACIETYWYAPDQCFLQLNWVPERGRAAAELLVQQGVYEPFSVPEDAHIRSDASLGSIESMRGPGDILLLQGEAVLPHCRYANRILITTGKDRTPILHTLGIRNSMASVLSCKQTATHWDATLNQNEAAVVENGVLQLWVYDEEGNILWHARDHVLTDA